MTNLFIHNETKLQVSTKDYLWVAYSKASFDMHHSNHDLLQQS